MIRDLAPREDAGYNGAGEVPVEGQAEEQPYTLTRKRRAWAEEYLRCWNATEAARRVGYAYPNTQGPRLLLDVRIQSYLRDRIREQAMGADEVLARLAQQASADLGAFFKVAERWTRTPRDTEEVIDESWETDEQGNPYLVYKVRAVVLDVDKLTNPTYSHLLKKFTDSPRSGLSVELYDGQHALELLGKHLRLFTDRHELSGPDGGPIQTEGAVRIYLPDNGRDAGGVDEEDDG